MGEQVFLGAGGRALGNEADGGNMPGVAGAGGTEATGAREVVFIETNIADWQTLAAGVSPSAEIVLLDAARDGLTQMAEWAKIHSGYEAIHIVSHGSQGALQLGSVTLTDAELAGREADLATLGQALTADGDLLLYGCDVAAGDKGIAFIRDLAAATGADVAASDDLTGAKVAGGDWLLEAIVGTVSDTLISRELPSAGFTGTLSQPNITFSFNDADGTVSTGNADDRKTLSQTIDGITATVSSNVNDVQAADYGGFGGSTDFVATNYDGDSSAEVTTLTVTFSSATNIISLIAGTAYGDTEAKKEYYVLTPTGGENSAVSFAIEDINQGAAKVDVNWTGVTSFTLQRIKHPSDSAYNNAALESGNQLGADLFIDSIVTFAPPSNTAPVLDLNGDGQGTANTVALATGASTILAPLATASDPENDLSGTNGNWNNGTLTVQRFTPLVGADANVNDLFSFASSDLFSVDGSDLKSDGTTFATVDKTNGVLTISFNANATTSLVQEVIQHIAYANTTPLGDANIRFSLNDGTTATTADVKVTSSNIYVTQTGDDAEFDAADGFSLREALARGAAQDTHDIIYLDAIATGTTLALNVDAPSWGDGDEIRNFSSGAKTLTIAGEYGGGLTLAGTATITDYADQTITISAPISGTGSLVKEGAGALVLSGANTYTGGTTLNAGTLTLNGGSALADSGAVMVAGGTLVLGNNETIGTLESSGGTLTLAGYTLTASGGKLDASGMTRSANDTGLLTTSNTSGTAITGTSSDDDIKGYIGADTLAGGDGNDRITGGSGADTLIGGKGEDTFIYASYELSDSANNTFIDTIDGGEGTDTLLLSFIAPNGFIFGSNIDWSSRISGIERIALSSTSSPVSLSFNAKAYAQGLRTIDLSKDTLSIIESNSVDLDEITGGGMTVIGSAGVDNIKGGAGDDTIAGGAGADTLTGGAGDDVFAGSVSDLNGDTITDLEAGDAIQLTGITSLTAANIRVTGTGSDTKIEIDTDATDFTTPEVTLNAPNLADAIFAVTSTNGGADTLITLDAPPKVTGVTSSTANGAYKVGDDISIQVQFSKVVNVSGTPNLKLETGTTDRVVDYVSGSGTDTLTFVYKVQDGDTSSDLDYLGTAALVLNGGSIQDAGGLNANLTLAIPGSTTSLGANKAIAIDTTAPTTTIAAASFSADTGSSDKDFVTQTANQTISGTLSANLASGEKVQVSLDDGKTWATAACDIAQKNWSLVGQTLIGSGTLKVKVSDTAGNDATVYSHAYALDTTTPTMSAMKVDGKTLTITLADSGGLDSGAPAAKVFSVKVGDKPAIIDTVAIDALTKIATLTLASPVSAGQKVTVSYTDLTSADDANGVIQDLAGNDLASFVDKVVTNTTQAPSSGGGGTGDTKTDTVDGVSVQTETKTGANGGTVTTTTIPTVKADRQESVGGNALADIPLVKTGETPLISVKVPTGVGMTASGTGAAQTVATGLDGLIAQIKAHTAEGSDVQTALTGGGKGFLSALPADKPLAVLTITPTIAEGADPNVPLVISGPGDGDATTATAIVIDSSNLPAGTVLELNDISFAAVVGNVSLTGGAGAQIIFADDGAQRIVLGADDDELHGGGGDDIVGSEGGDDRLFGEGGNDTMFGGEGADLIHGGRDHDTVTYEGQAAGYEITRDHAVVTVRSLSDPTDVDTLVNVETITFADKTIELSYEDDLSLVAGLYQQLFGRQGDLAGVQFWTKRLADGGSAGDVMLDVFASEEAQAQGFTHFGPNGEASLELLYEVLFDRNSDRAGFDFWQQALDEGMSLKDIADRFAHSLEMKTDHSLGAEAWQFLI
ncbi:autotransporter-associated beta strand repeat-containing protein [Fulvimarina manganoxydans]|uniref:Autotransporter-associated beta strand repeat-containing protein n=1 Tax=Fulvimarina manganoxydans TaxID=937218 RepID=A0A1W2EM94_9HYPH|nr:DUF4347 domain-containing protein [Fulvimarina manganoxydans]SMD10829.1 autotransporter-associated beta strand repeat-containing protein [Fulvimarina manganoxydans]